MNHPEQPPTADELYALVQSDLRHDTNEFRGVLVEFTEDAQCLLIAQDLLYGDDLLEAATRLKAALEKHAAQYVEMEVARRLDRPTSGLARRLGQSVAIAEIFQDFHSGKAFGMQDVDPAVVAAARGIPK